MMPAESHTLGKLFISLLLAIIHLAVGFLILLVASWFIAACSIAGLGFNYMLPAVVIRGLAILRIGSGYFSMLIGHSYLLDKLASIRLKIFAGIRNQTGVSRQQSLDALHCQSEEVAAIWMSWVSQNAGTVLSLILLNFVCLIFIPILSPIMLLFSGFFVIVYSALLYTMSYKSDALVNAKQQVQFDIFQHVEASPVWHLYANYRQQAPDVNSLRTLEHAIQSQIRTASFFLFVSAITALAVGLSLYSSQLTGNALFIIVPIALLSINDWLTPTLNNQKQLLHYIDAKRAINRINHRVQNLQDLECKVNSFNLINFKAAATQMPKTNTRFSANTINVIIGSSGVGKSRFLQALNGLLPFEGQRNIIVKAANESYVEQTCEGLLSDCLYIEQFPYILSDTLRANLQVANSNASDVLLLQVLRQVGLSKFTNLELWVGENGHPLSGGEKKRLGLARALLTESGIVLFDEPFEALDEINIAKVAETINRLADRKTIVLATHILPTNLKYQQCISLDKTSYNHASGDVQFGAFENE